MPKFTLATAGGPVEVEGRRFSHYINNVRFWFAVHDAHDRSNLVVVTHIDSGMRVCQVPFLSLQAALGDRPLAARAALDALVERAGAEKVYTTLSNAEKTAQEASRA